MRSNKTTSSKSVKGEIYTLNGYKNYGNRLQLFALSKTLSDLNIKTGIYWPKTIIRRLKLFIKLKTPLAVLYKKERKLWKFTKKHVCVGANKKPSVIIVGSDQVWNPKYLADSPYLLEAPRDDALIISYAASIGAKTLTNEQKALFSKSLRKYDAISVREQSAKDALQPLVPGKNIKVVLDPTLLLEKSEYELLEKQPNNLKQGEKYVLCYILGDQKYQNEIEEYATRNGLKIILFSDKRDSSYGVEEFLYLIHHAELICTDSFHACVFSFIFDRPFVAFRRTGEENYMYTRLDNFVKTFKLENREFNGKKITSDNLKIDYKRAKSILKTKQKESIDFLKKALSNYEKK